MMPVKHAMRIFLLRLLVGWWVILYMWSIGWVIAWLLFGRIEATELVDEVARVVWYGEL